MSRFALDLSVPAHNSSLRCEQPLYRRERSGTDQPLVGHADDADKGSKQGRAAQRSHYSYLWNQHRDPFFDTIFNRRCPLPYATMFDPIVGGAGEADQAKSRS